MIKSYKEALSYETFEERYSYLRLHGEVGAETFGFDRYVNQMLYRSRRWLSLRNEIIIRDEACDLAILGFEIYDRIIVHHINPITIEDIELGKSIVFNPNNLICTTHTTHLAIHYGDATLLPKMPIVRRPGDTTPWR